MTVIYEMRRTKTQNIFSYETKDGEIKFMYRLHLGKVEVNGEMKPKNTTGRGFNSISEALEAREEKLASFIAQKESTKENPILFRELAYRWLEEYATGNIEPSTFSKTSGLVKNHIIPVMGDYEFNEIKGIDCKRFIKAFSTRIVNFEQLTNYASQILQHAVLEEFIPANPFDKLNDSDKKGGKKDKSKPQKNAIEKRNYFLAEEINTLLDYLEKENSFKEYLFFRVLAYTGARRAEIFALTWKDIDFNAKTIAINKAIGYASSKSYSLIKYPEPIKGFYEKDTKNGLNRCLAIDDVTLALLIDWQKQQKQLLKMLNLKHKSHKQLVFQNTRNSFINLNNTSTWLSKAKLNLSFANTVEISSKTFRHSFATLCALHGVPVIDIQHRLGHAGDNTTTKYYIHATDYGERKTCEAYVKILDDARQTSISSDNNFS